MTNGNCELLPGVMTAEEASKGELGMGVVMCALQVQLPIMFLK